MLIWVCYPHIQPFLTSTHSCVSVFLGLLPAHRREIVRHVRQEEGVSTRLRNTYRLQRHVNVHARESSDTSGRGHFVDDSSSLQNLPSLNVCRGFSGLSSAIMLPASSGLIGSLFPAGRKRTLAYVAITCGECNVPNGPRPADP
jgi:MFS family permease